MEKFAGEVKFLKDQKKVLQGKEDTQRVPALLQGETMWKRLQMRVQVVFSISNIFPLAFFLSVSISLNKKKWMHYLINIFDLIFLDHSHFKSMF